MARYFLELAYKGTQYNGWQIQPAAPSVQETLQKALSTLLRSHTPVTGAGRTDAGVHASFYVAHFDNDDAELHLKPGFCYHLNAVLPGDVAVNRIYAVKNDAHARFSALSREYKYFISCKKDPFSADTAYRLTIPLDIGQMNNAASILLYTSDFSSFEKSHSDNKTSLCTVYSAQWEKQGERLVFTIEADRFLRNMVRAIVGTLIDVGKGKLSVSRFNEIVGGKSRMQAGSSAPACGLFLTGVKYPENIAL